jgi:UDP-N-acetylmuramate dehydrogenase
MPLRITDNAPLDALNTFGVSARARRLVELDDPADLPAALAALVGAPARLVLGGGSNLLLAGDFDGTVLRMRTRGRQRQPAAIGEEVSLQAGESWDEAVRWTLDQGLAGLENLAMIPGTCGAAAIQNIGAYGVELAERFAGLWAVDLDTGRQQAFTPEACRFGYRDSVFKQPGGERWLILRLRLRVGPQFAPVLSYAPLAAAFAGRSATPSAAEVATEVRRIRASRLPDPARIGNAGSFFKNPVVNAALAQALHERHPGMPMHPGGSSLSDAPVKLSAGWLIEQCGWKGHRDGDAGVHADHALVLVNHGRASGAELLRLAMAIRASVHERFGLWLEPEPRIVGGS